MTHALALRRVRRRDPEDPVSGALLFYSLVAATGFAAGWLGQALGAF
jgi:hypothetical protein